MTKPRPWNGMAPTTMMKNVYQRDQPFFDQAERTQYSNGLMEYGQDRVMASDALAVGNQLYANPDIAQRAYSNGRHVTMRSNRSMLVSSKALF